MIQVLIKNLAGEVTHESSFETQALADQWIASQEIVKAFGKPERWVDAEDVSEMGEDRSLSIASQQVGGPEDERTQYKFAAEYSVVQSDISEKVAIDKANAVAQACLASTDWYVVRLAETQKPIPADVLAARASARAAITKV